MSNTQRRCLIATLLEASEEVEVEAEVSPVLNH
jgi:hypothetical protein